MYNYDARLYDPALRMFISADSLLPNIYDPQQLNRFAYCRNNPIKYVDPSGHLLNVARGTTKDQTGRASEEDKKEVMQYLEKISNLKDEEGKPVSVAKKLNKVAEDKNVLLNVVVGYAKDPVTGKVITNQACYDPEKAMKGEKQSRVDIVVDPKKEFSDGNVTEKGLTVTAHEAFHGIEAIYGEAKAPDMDSMEKNMEKRAGKATNQVRHSLSKKQRAFYTYKDSKGKIERIPLETY